MCNHCAECSALQWIMHLYMILTFPFDNRSQSTGMAKVLPIIDVLGYDGQNSLFSSPSPPHSDSTPITQQGSHISTLN